MNVLREAQWLAVRTLWGLDAVIRDQPHPPAYLKTLWPIGYSQELPEWSQLITAQYPPRRVPCACRACRRAFAHKYKT